MQYSVGHTEKEASVNRQTDVLCKTDKTFEVGTGWVLAFQVRRTGI
jgi:hypothetical protein